MSAAEEPISNELWPLRPQPCQGELFSSWLVRVARCYEMPAQAFCRQVWPGREVWCANLDRQIDDEALRLLSRKTGVPYQNLFLMTLRAHEQFAGVSATDESARDLYFSFGNTDQAIRFCPACLAERPPYYKLDWRLAFITVCAGHRLPLAERCDRCKAPCLFANTDVHRPFTSCHRCGKGLLFVDQDVTTEMALQIELQVEFQQNVLDVLRNSALGR